MRRLVLALLAVVASSPRIVKTAPSRSSRSMVEKDYWVFEWNGTALRDTGVRVSAKSGAAAIRMVEK